VGYLPVSSYTVNKGFIYSYGQGSPCALALVINKFCPTSVMKFQVISLHKKREEKLREKTAQKLAPQQVVEVCDMLESNKDSYKNAVRLYEMYRRANKFSNRVLDTPKLDGKPQDCTQTHSVSRSVDNAALSTLQSRLARLEHHLCREQCRGKGK